MTVFNSLKIQLTQPFDAVQPLFSFHSGFNFSVLWKCPAALRALNCGYAGVLLLRNNIFIEIISIGNEWSQIILLWTSCWFTSFKRRLWQCRNKYHKRNCSPSHIHSYYSNLFAVFNSVWWVFVLLFIYSSSIAFFVFFFLRTATCLGHGIPPIGDLAIIRQESLSRWGYSPFCTTGF